MSRDGARLQLAKPTHGCIRPFRGMSKRCFEVTATTRNGMVGSTSADTQMSPNPLVFANPRECTPLPHPQIHLFKG